MRHTPHLIDGRRHSGEAERRATVFRPDSGQPVGEVGLADAEVVDLAVRNAAEAQPRWASTNPQRRARVMTRFVELVHSDMTALAALLSEEHGKTIADSKGDLLRGLEVIEFAAGAPHLLKGEFSQGAGAGIDVYSMREPLGVVAGITPFNFPAMVPMWKFGPALACGNAVVLKPSERVPSLPLRLAELMLEAGLPAGVLNVVNGDKEAVDALLTHPLIQAVGFVGSSDVASYVHSTASAQGKRSQCFGSAKNHMIVMPDADLEEVANAVVGAAFGTGGERCMAISVLVPVGKETADRLAGLLVPRIQALRVGPSDDEAADFGPLITRDSVDRVNSAIDSGVRAGASLLVDGRDIKVANHENGFFAGPSFFDHVTPEMSIYRDEIFGPVLAMVRASSYQEAVNLPIVHEFGNGTTIFTDNGKVARDFVTRVNVGMVGVNVPIPVPVSYYTFGGWKRSGFGDLNQHGPDAFRFYTRTKTVTARWLEPDLSAPSFVIPTMS